MGMFLLVFDVPLLICDDIKCIVVFDDMAIIKSFFDMRYKDFDDAP